MRQHDSFRNVDLKKNYYVFGFVADLCEISNALKSQKGKTKIKRSNSIRKKTRQQ